jgi:hypothetical protein
LDKNYALPSLAKWMASSAVVWILPLGGMFYVIFHVAMKVPGNLLFAPFVGVSVVGNAGMALIYCVKKFVRGPRRRAFGVMLAGAAAAIASMLILATEGLKDGILNKANARSIYGTIAVTAVLCTIIPAIMSKWFQGLYQGGPQGPSK